MTKENLNNVNFESEYKNFGQKVEQIYRYAHTGKIMKADNRKGADLKDIQIKSNHCTCSRGTLDIEEYVKNDGANRYVYITRTKIAYLMTKNEYIEMVKLFAKVDRDSSKNGGKQTLRLRDSKKLYGWLESHC